MDAAIKVAILLGLPPLTKHIDDVLKPVVRERLSSLIFDSDRRLSKNWLQNINQSFLEIFDSIYFGSSATWNVLIWGIIFGALGFSILVQIIARIFGYPNLPLFWILILSIPFGFMSLSLTFEETRSILKRSKFIVWTVSCMAFMLIYKHLHPDVIPVLKSGGLEILALSKFLLFILTILLLINVTNVLIISPYRLIYRIPISPLRAAAFSLAGVVVIGLVFHHFSLTFLNDFKIKGWAISALLLLNVFVDCVSLLETRIVLKFAAHGGLIRLVSLLILDIFVSAILFLIIPLVAGYISPFIQAILFKGPMPWLGILFWSSLVTSIIFYSFCVVSFVLKMLIVIARGFKMLGKAMAVKRHPMLSLGVTADLILFVFWIL